MICGDSAVVGRRLQRLKLVLHRRRLARPRVSGDALHSEGVWIAFSVSVRLVLAGSVIKEGLDVSTFGSCYLSAGLPSLLSLVIGRHITIWCFAIAAAELFESLTSVALVILRLAMPAGSIPDESNPLGSVRW